MYLLVFVHFYMQKLELLHLLLNKFIYLIRKIHCTKFLRIYQTNHLNLTLNYTVRVANIDFIWFFTLKCFAESFEISL